ncbi:GRIP and coiled-coil domain-containing protein 2 [Anopheles bellator]|uniref:GRIP and coiled-coil domain-containing protein 2 n=1 Tax=Anopheles bellator TaxID=139047 RepID=UPI00264783F3|nr:GRIP and coiled-coil domain-containing protein 2 [Anopheles bellator]
MSSSQASDQDPATARKPGPFDNLSRDDLVKKCKGLLGIAQKAKQAKDECQEENRHLKEQLDHYETQKNADKECIKAMQEVADSYMDQKLKATMRVDELEKQLQKTVTQLSDEKSSHEKLHQQLLGELDDLRNTLIQSERNAAQNAGLAERLRELEEDNAKLEKERIKLEQELIRVKGSQVVLSEQNAKEEKLIRKLKLYKAKVLEINAKLLLLKSDRKILLKTVKDYAEQVPKWQKELANASNVLFAKIHALELEKSDLSEKITLQVSLADGLRCENEELQRKLAAVTHQGNSDEDMDLPDSNRGTAENETLIESLRLEVENLKLNNLSLATESQGRLLETEKLQQDVQEKENIFKDLETTKALVADLETKLTSQSSLLSDSHKMQAKLSERLEETLEKMQQVQSDKKCLEAQLKSTQEELERKIENVASVQKLHAECQSDMQNAKQELENSEKEKIRLSDLLKSSSVSGNEKTENLAACLKESEAKFVMMEEKNREYRTKVLALESTIQSQASRFDEQDTARDKVRKQLEENQQLVQQLIVENQNLEGQLGQLAEKLKSSLETSKKAAARNEELEKKLSLSIQDVTGSNVEKEQLQQELKLTKDREVEMAEKYALLKGENSELLLELKEINEIMKERGEVINLQLSKISELQEKLSNVEAADVVPMKQQIGQLQQTINEKDAELERQRDELIAVKERSNISFDTQSDVMSTSTISRVEDVARMRELDEGFEEKYIKLRSLAVKLKRKVAEQTALLQKYEKESLSGADPSSLATVSKNVQTLQTENDRLQDQLESVRQELESKRAELESKSIELTTLQQVQKDIEGTKKDRGSLETAVREYQVQIQSLKREKEAFQLAKREIDAENQRLKSTLKSKEKELADEQEQQKELRSELDRTKLAVKKANVLSLEMEAYERSLTELNNKLETKKTLVKELEAKIEMQDTAMKSLKQQITLLEESLESQQRHSRELKQEVDIQQGKLRQSEHQRMELTSQLEELHEEHDRAKQLLESNRLELEQVASEKEKVFSTLELEKTSLQKQSLTLESELSTLRTALAERQQEVEDMRTEFASYKVRAQSVLRQNQNKDSSREKELEEELSQLQKSLELVEGKHLHLVKQVNDLSKSNEGLKSEKERTQNRCKELLSLLEESRLQSESLLEETRKTNLEHQEALKTQRVQSETLIQCYKAQLEEQQERHCQELEQLQTRIRQRSEVDGANGVRHVLNNNLPPHGSLHPAPIGAIVGRTAAFTDEQRINLLLMEREEGEGSESTNLSTVAGASQRRKLSSTSISRGRTREVIPLDELLNTSFDDSASVGIIDGEGDHHNQFFDGREPSPTVELQQTKEQLSKQESRVRHLTAVLAEAEQDLAKLTQLNELLKEEVRRQQRSIEREAHVHNSEYLKNVIFKFITLNNGDERSRLVPVLNTILKLSPDETQKLQNVAKGSDPSSRGWTGLLWN